MDRMSVQVYSGKGGAGGVAFHREKFMVSHFDLPASYNTVAY